jgi:hypothetical protein
MPPHARLQHVARARPLGDLTIDVKRHETAVIEDRLRAFERPDGWLLHDAAGAERLRLLEFSRQRVPARHVADAPDPLARRAESGLDEERERTSRRQRFRRMNDLGRRLRDVERAEQRRCRLALNLFECGEIRQRGAERRWQATAGGGEQLRLFVNGQEDVDRAACNHVEHGGEIALGVASAGGRRVDTGDEARESR